MIARRHQVARLSIDFYRDKFRKTLLWILVFLGIIFILIAINFYLLLFKPVVPYYANTTEGRILPMPQAIY